VACATSSAGVVEGFGPEGARDGLGAPLDKVRRTNFEQAYRQGTSNTLVDLHTSRYSQAKMNARELLQWPGRFITGAFMGLYIYFGDAGVSPSVVGLGFGAVSMCAGAYVLSKRVGNHELLAQPAALQMAVILHAIAIEFFGVAVIAHGAHHHLLGYTLLGLAFIVGAARYRLERGGLRWLTRSRGDGISPSR
jgi:hypothetical protein